MKDWLKRALVFLLAAWMLLGLILPVLADETTPAEEGGPFISIHTVEELQAMAQNPSGHYRLEEDLDMKGILWEPVDFTGVFDGGGHALLNLTLTQTGTSQAEVLDGNRKAYQAKFAGLFGKLENAEVRNLNLFNVTGVLETDEPCFMGSIAGYSYESTITDCYIKATTELRAHNQIFGLGGVVGYGSGKVDRCGLDVTLICVDTDRETKDEQFLGGVYSTGFMDVTNCKIKIGGYVSEHGYSHNGGITGMYMQNPLGMGKVGEISYNTVKGKIKFFENNRDRRAYCDAYYGEVLASRYTLYDNRRDFDREEVKQYDQEIRPCMCEEPEVYDWHPRFRCDQEEYGYSCEECFSCGYEYRFDYTLKSHKVTDWRVVEAATETKEGLSEGNCDLCGKLETRVDPVVIPEETEPTQPAVTIPDQQALVDQMEEEREQIRQERSQMQGKIGKLVMLLAGAMVVLIAIIIYLIIDLVKSKKNRR